MEKKVDDYVNPIISRRLGSPGSRFCCWLCPGEVLTQVSHKTRQDALPILYGSHEFRLQLWKDHRPALESWLSAVNDEVVSHIRRFRIHTQFLGEAIDIARSPNYGSAMPGYLQINLDAEAGANYVIISDSWTRHLLADSSRRVMEIVDALPRMEGKPVLTRKALLEMIDAVGWFGFRNKKEIAMFAELEKGKAIARASLANANTVSCA